MIKILIVDDESTIRRGLEKAIPWKENGFVVAGTAKNGIDALDFFTNNYADIVISDIRMPRMDGLQLQETLHERYPDLPFLFISGYEDFNYARQALRCGAFSYLLKPLDPAELIAELKRACEHYHLSTENIPLKQIIERNFYGLEKRWDFTNFEYLEHEFQNNYFCVMNIRCQMDDMKSQIFLMAFQKRLQDIVFECFTQSNSALIESSGRGIVFCIMNADEKHLKYSLNTFVSSIAQKLGEYASTPLGIWTGGVYQGITRLIDSYIESFESDTFKYFNQSNETQMNLECFDTYSQLFDNEDIIISTLYNGKVDDAIMLLENQKSFLMQNNHNSDDARLYLRHLLHKYLRGLKSANPDVVFPESFHSYGTFALMTISEMFKNLYESLEQISKFVKPVTSNHSLQTIDKIKEYIDRNYSDPYLSLSSIADYVGLNASYVSTEFAKREKKGLSNYITDIRIARAKHLLLYTDKTVSEICDEVGYLNPTYFSTTFKKSVGFTPSQFRKQPNN